jgi:hypothetical protein
MLSTRENVFERDKAVDLAEASNNILLLQQRRK